METTEIYTLSLHDALPIWMGGDISRMEEVAPTASNIGNSPAMQTQRLTLLLQDDRRAPANHVRQLIHVPVRQPDTPVRHDVPDIPRIRRPMDSRSEEHTSEL